MPENNEAADARKASILVLAALIFAKESSIDPNAAFDRAERFVNAAQARGYSLAQIMGLSGAV